ncbi:hypothetical protein [Paractinoplanes maris]|uniref:hypothetical protein n=1 Tax=Paractinoplanes maris TaxID=1734446 RepID=UPI0020222D2C|nr:hypothetical protein [Actinoplanes maris]
MSLATHTALAGDSDDRDAALAAFRATVPAAAAYDLAELTAEGPVREHRPHRSTATAKAITESERDFS